MAEKTEEISFEFPEDVTGGRNLTKAARAERNRLIVMMKLRGFSWPQVAEKAGITTRGCKMVMAAYRAQNPTLRHNDPVEIVDELLDGYQGVLNDLADVAANAPNDAVKVGALNSKMKAFREMGELLQAIGVLPHDLGTLRLEIDARIVAERVLAILERAGLPDSVYDEILEALGGPPPELDPSLN